MSWLPLTAGTAVAAAMLLWRPVRALPGGGRHASHAIAGYRMPAWRSMAARGPYAGGDGRDLVARGADGSDGAMGSAGPGSGERPGLAILLTLVEASLRAGADVPTALERQVGTGLTDAHGDLDAHVLARRLRRLARGEETDGEIRDVAAGLCAAVETSRVLGCPAARCVQAVRASAGRLRLREELRRNAFAVPRSTVRLLMGLPVVTVMLGQFLGADPLGVLFGSWQGACLLVAGLSCHAAGAVWMGRLLRTMGGNGNRRRKPGREGNRDRGTGPPRHRLRPVGEGGP